PGLTIRADFRRPKRQSKRSCTAWASAGSPRWKCARFKDGYRTVMCARVSRSTSVSSGYAAPGAFRMSRAMPKDYVGEALAKKKKKKANGMSANDLLVEGGNLPAVAFKVRDLLRDSGKLFDRGIPVKLVVPADGGIPSASPLNGEGVVIEAHRHCRPVRMTKD